MKTRTPSATLHAATVALATTFAFGPVAWAQSGDGAPPRLEAARSHPTGLRCEAGQYESCPAFPRASTLDKNAMMRALHELAGCGEADHGPDTSPITAGDPKVVTEALAHLALVEKGMSLHARKMALELIVDLGSASAAEHLSTAYEVSSALAALAFEGLALPKSELEAMVDGQAEEMRRVVVLAAARVSHPSAEALIERALEDPSPSVSIAAKKALTQRAQAPRD